MNNEAQNMINELKEKPVINDGETLYFAANEQMYAISLKHNTLHNCCPVDGVHHEQVPAHELAFDIEQDWDNETTTFVFEDFKIIYSDNDVRYA